MLMPEDKPQTDLIMIATGTGIAPYRSFVRRLFGEATPAAEAYKGTAWLFLGVANSDALLYDAEWQDVLKKHPDNFRLDYALSREQTNKDGGKMYIQDKVGRGPAGRLVVVFCLPFACLRGGGGCCAFVVCCGAFGNRSRARRAVLLDLFGVISVNSLMMLCAACAFEAHESEAL